MIIIGWLALGALGVLRSMPELAAAEPKYRIYLTAVITCTGPLTLALVAFGLVWWTVLRVQGKTVPYKVVRQRRLAEAAAERAEMLQVRAARA